MMDPGVSSEKDTQYISSYMAPWEVYGIAFSCKPSQPYRLAISSIITDGPNHIEIIKYNRDNGRLEKKASCEVQYAPTKIMWVPDPSGASQDLFATSGDKLRLWSVENNDKLVEKVGFSKTNMELGAPLTSFDWDPQQLNQIITCSVDTTCTLWDISQNSIIRTLIAHEKEVMDVSYSPERYFFATAGADGSIRQFDMRDLSKSDILYETNGGSESLLRVAWNKNNKFHIAVVSENDNSVIILDTRKHLIAYAKLSFHRAPVNNLAWAPQSANHLCTVSDDRLALIWDIKKISTELKNPMLSYSAPANIANVSWGSQETDWVAMTLDKQVQILRAY